MRAADFLDTLGVNTHIGADPYNNPAQIASMLSYLGIGNVRQTSPTDAASMANMRALGESGAKLDLVINGGGPVDLAGALATAKQLAPHLNAIENVNEVAIWPIQYKGLDGVDAAVALQKDLYAAVKADPALSKLPVYIFTLGGVDPGAFPSIGDLSAYTDYANIHSYPPHGLRPCFVIHAAIAGGRTSAPSKPVVITETGFYTLPQHDGWGGVPEAVQASYLLGLLLDEAAAGVSRTYLYDLIDDGPDPRLTEREHHFGLFRYDGSPKVAATAIHNLTTLLADTGADRRNFQLDEFSYTATGVPYDYTGNTMVFQKSDGTRTIAVWNEQQLWNPDTRTASAPQHVPVTVDLKRNYGTVLVFDPVAGTSPIQVLHDVSKVELDLVDRPLLVQIPAPSAAVPAVAAARPEQTLVLHVSEDAWQGDAQFKVTVDGREVGGVQTVTASRAAGQSQAVTLTGAFGAGPHTLGITFLNDAWGGTPGTDRNLYLESVEFGGWTLADARATMLSNGTLSYVLPPAKVGDASAPAAAETKMDTLVLYVSEDAWRGDARFKVAVDGREMGGVQTATASRAAGQSQAVTFTGAFGAGSHKLAVTFLNDAWGGTPGTDRNLYVEGVEFNGQRLADARAALTKNGTWTYVLPPGKAAAVSSSALTGSATDTVLPAPQTAP